MYILFTAVLCAALCFCVVYPLWLFATTSSHLYSIIVISAILAFLVFVLIRKLYKKNKLNRRLIFVLLTILITVISLCLFVRFVLSEQRIIALVILAAGIYLAVFTARLRKRFPDE